MRYSENKKKKKKKKKVGNLFYRNIFHSSGKESKFLNGMLVELLSEVRRRLVGTLISILIAGSGCNVLGLGKARRVRVP
jgi:hypothetical protein